MKPRNVSWTGVTSNPASVFQEMEKKRRGVRHSTERKRGRKRWGKKPAALASVKMAITKQVTRKSQKREWLTQIGVRNRVRCHQNKGRKGGSKKVKESHQGWAKGGLVQHRFFGR